MKRELDAVIELSQSGKLEDAKHVAGMLGFRLEMDDDALMAAAKRAQSENKGSDHPGLAALADALYVNLNKPDSTRSTDTIRKLFTAMQELNRADQADDPDLYGDINLKDPASYANAKMQKIATEIHRRPGLLPEGMPFVVFKARILSGEYPDLVRADLDREAAEDAAKNKRAATQQKKAGNAKEALQEMTLPTGYFLRYEQAAKQFTLSGKFDEDLNTRIRRAGGAWNGVSKGNRRLWEIPEGKAASLKTVLNNWMESSGSAIEAKASRDKEEAERIRLEREKSEAALKAVRDEAGKDRIKDGYYGRVSVSWNGKEYRVGFPYSTKSVEAIKRIGGHGYDPTTKQWGIYPEDKAKLQGFIDDHLAEDEAARKSVESQQAQVDAGEAITIADWSRSYPNRIRIGELMIIKGKAYRVSGESAVKRISAEDVSSMGGPIGEDVDMYRQMLTLTPDESQEGKDRIKAEVDRRAEAERKAEVAKERKRLSDEITSAGDFPAGMNDPEGEIVASTRSIYGSGDWFVVGKDAIWYVRNNGMDGDTWSANNVMTGGAGALGWRVPFSQELADRIRALAE